MRFLKIIFLLFLLIYPFTIKSAVAQSAVTSSFNPQTVTAAPNQDFTVNVRLNASAAFKVRMYQINMSFDTGKAQVKSITYKVGTKSDVLGGDGDQNLTTINASGQIKLIGELAAASPFVLPQGVSTSFAEIVFTSRSLEQYNINIAGSSFLKNVKSDLSLETLPVSPSSMTINQAALPSPSPTVSPSPPPPLTPVCTRFELSGLTKSSTRNSDGGPIYTASSQGSNNQFDISVSPGSATVAVTAISQTTGAPDLTITETNTGTTIVRVANIPPNTSETQDNTYRIRATVTSGTQEVNCLPIQVIVPKIGIGVGAPTTCPADIQSTEVKFRNADNTGSWTGQKTIAQGQSVKVAGFHNKITPDTPPSDIGPLSVSGPLGFSSTHPKGEFFTPPADLPPGAYVFTAKTTDKVGDKCSGTATLVVTAPSPSPSPSPPPPPPAVGTGCFFMDDKPIIAKFCSDADAQAYDTHPKVIPLILTTAGKKTIFVRFVSNLGVSRDFQRVINFKPEPKITEASCTHSLSGSGSVVTVNGSALGPRGKGKVKVGGADATIITWNETTGIITATLDKRIEGKNEVEVTRDDSKTAKAECTVGTTSVTFIAQSQCKPSGNFSAEGVSVKIFANAPTTIETEKPEPIISEKVKLDKDGKPSGFAPKLEKDKKYSLIVKAPGTLAKRVDFETKGGTRNLDSATLLTGDIAPAQNPDGKINAFDRSELTRQWSLVKDVQRSGDFNQDGRINSIDYACMRQNINQSDEEFSPTVPKASPAPVGVGTTTPAGIGTTTPAGVGTTSPPPAGGPSGTLPFRISFDPNFTTIALDGDFGENPTRIISLTLPPGPGLKSVYMQFYENGVWGPTPPQTSSILLE